MFSRIFVYIGQFFGEKKKASERCNFHCQTLRFLKLSEIMVLIILTQNYAAEE